MGVNFFFVFLLVCLFVVIVLSFLPNRSGSLSTASASNPFTVQINLGVDVSVKSDNLVNVKINKILFSVRNR